MTYKNGAIFCPTLYVQCSRKFITTSERLNSFEVDWSQVKSSRVGYAQVDRRRLGVIL